MRNRLILSLLSAMLLSTPLAKAEQTPQGNDVETLVQLRLSSADYAEELGMVSEAAELCEVEKPLLEGATSFFTELLRLGGERHRAGLHAWFEHGRTLVHPNAAPAACPGVEASLSHDIPRLLAGAHHQVRALIDNVEATLPQESWPHRFDVRMPLPPKKAK